jgi:hypothetical protein
MTQGNPMTIDAVDDEEFVDYFAPVENASYTEMETRKEMREAILDQVTALYHEAAAAAGWLKPPKDVAVMLDEIFELTTKACRIKE